METIKVSATQLKRVYILDCCYAGKAFPFLQTSAIGSDRTDELLRYTLRHVNRSENYGALFASGHNNLAVYLPDETNTFFTEAFLRVVTNTTEFLSLLDVKERMNTHLDDLLKIYEQTYHEVPIPPLPQIYESEVAQLPLFPSTVIQTDQLIIEVAQCLKQTSFREIRLIYCDLPTRTVRVLCSKFQGDQDFDRIFRQIKETTGWRVKVDVWEEIASIIARPITSPPIKKEDVGLNGANGQELHRKTNSKQNLTEEIAESNRLEKAFKITIEDLVNGIGKPLQSSHYQPTQALFQIVVPGVTEQEKQILKSKFQDKHRGYKLGVAAHA